MLLFAILSFSHCQHVDLAKLDQEIFYTLYEIYNYRISDLRTKEYLDFQGKANKGSDAKVESELAFFIEYSKMDSENIDEIMNFQKTGLMAINLKLENNSQLTEFIMNIDKSKQKSIIADVCKYCKLAQTKFNNKKTLFPLFLNIQVFSIINSPFFQIDDIEKACILKENVLPFLIQFATNHNLKNMYLEELIFDCKSRILVLESNFKLGYDEIEKLKVARSKRFNSNDLEMALLVYLKMKLLIKEGKYDLAIFEFKKIPDSWIDLEQEKDRIIKFQLASAGADAYLEMKNYTLSKVWREVAISVLYTVDFVSGREVANQQADLLRSIYLEEKSWTLLRNLEGRMSKFGMKPLSKQPGE